VRSASKAEADVDARKLALMLCSGVGRKVLEEFSRQRNLQVNRANDSFRDQIASAKRCGWRSFSSMRFVWPTPRSFRASGVNCIIVDEVFIDIERVCLAWRAEESRRERFRSRDSQTRRGGLNSQSFHQVRRDNFYIFGCSCLSLILFRWAWGRHPVGAQKAESLSKKKILRTLEKQIENDANWAKPMTSPRRRKTHKNPNFLLERRALSCLPLE
jgi:hypothetical protein